MRTTVTLNDKLYRALKQRAFDSNENISTIIEQALQYQLLEDLEDLEDANHRSTEPAYSFDGLVKTLKAEGLLK
jgi:predicted transcriptional regulator